jgi:hypothetical protein
MLAKENQRKKSMANYRKEAAYANRIYESQPSKQNLHLMTMLVGDEIHKKLKKPTNDYTL